MNCILLDLRCQRLLYQLNVSHLEFKVAEPQIIKKCRIIITCIFYHWILGIKASWQTIAEKKTGEEWVVLRSEQCEVKDIIATVSYSCGSSVRWFTCSWEDQAWRGTFFPILSSTWLVERQDGWGGKRKLVYNPPLTREQEDELAEAIHGCPDIWDKKKDGHRNVDTVSRFFDSMNKKYFNGKKDGAQNWLKSQRRNLTEAMRKQKLHSGDDGEEPHLQPKEAWAVSKLAFVRPQVINEINTVNCFLFVCVWFLRFVNLPLCSKVPKKCKSVNASKIIRFTVFYL